MRQCLIFRRLISLFGLLMPLCIGLSAKAAPSCSSVLLKPVNFEAVLTDVARMKLELDLQMIEGSQSQLLANKQLPEMYRDKLHELLQLMEGRRNEEQVRELLRERVRDLQGHKRESDQTAQRIREEHADLLTHPRTSFELPFTINARQKGDPSPFVFAEHFADAQKIIVSDASGKLHLYDQALKKYSSLSFGPILAVGRVPGKNEIVTVDATGEVHLRDISGVSIEKLGVIPAEMLKFNSDLLHSLVVEKTGSRMAMLWNGNVIFISKKSVWQLSDHVNVLPDSLEGVTFTSSTKGMITYKERGSQTLSVMHFDFAKEEVAYSSNGDLILELIPSPQKGSMLAVREELAPGSTGKGHFVFARFNGEDISKKPLLSIALKNRSDRISAYSIAGTSHVLVNQKSGVKNNLEIYDLADPTEAVFQFTEMNEVPGNSTGAIDILKVSFSEDARSALFIYTEENAKGEKVNKMDIWRLR